LILSMPSPPSPLQNVWSSFLDQLLVMFFLN
jgi:hypothetical protein